MASHFSACEIALRGLTRASTFLTVAEMRWDGVEHADEIMCSEVINFGTKRNGRTEPVRARYSNYALREGIFIANTPLIDSESMDESVQLNQCARI